jgi:hypothetical protein
MLAGSTSDGPYIWGGLMPCVSVLLNIYTPEQGTRPMSANASGFVPEVEQALSF